jgi:hypothetical protein
MILQHLIAHAIGRTQAGQLANMFGMVIFVAILPIVSVSVLSGFVWHELAMESDYHRHFGSAWEAQYEADQGPLSTARTKAGAAMLGAMIDIYLGIWLYRRFFPPLLSAEYHAPSRNWGVRHSRSRRRRHRQ